MLKLALLALFSSAHLFAQNLKAPCSPTYGELPLRAGGRVKPLIVQAEESLRFITGKGSLGDEPASVTFCRLSFESLGLPSGIDLPVRVEHVEAKQLLGVPEGEASLPMSKLEAQLDEVRAAHAARKENDAFKKELQRLLNRHHVWSTLTRGETWTVPVEEGSKTAWVPLPQFLSEEKVQATGGPDPFATLFNQAAESYERREGAVHRRELLYHRAQPFVWSMALTLLALALTVGFKSLTPALVFTGLTLALQTFGMVLRVLVSGRAPITNMYETVMFSGFGALLLAFALTLWKRERNFLLGGLAYNMLCLMMMKFATGMLDPAISPLVPVLRDNFWLSTHVTTIILSYAALALSWILANVVLVRQIAGKDADMRHLTEQIYTCLKFGVVLLSAGIILGGVWADYSWGRFWGWDPKETWSLIVLLVYMAILHGKSTNWITPARFVPLVAGAFLSVMMAWFGVNYILATGLHSYGFSEGGAIFLGSFFAAQLIILGMALVRMKRA